MNKHTFDLNDYNKLPELDVFRAHFFSIEWQETLPRVMQDCELMRLARDIRSLDNSTLADTDPMWPLFLVARIACARSVNNEMGPEAVP